MDFYGLVKDLYFGLGKKIHALHTNIHVYHYIIIESSINKITMRTSDFQYRYLGIVYICVILKIGNRHDKNMNQY